VYIALLGATAAARAVTLIVEHAGTYDIGASRSHDR
jgi:hypothetical protein